MGVIGGGFIKILHTADWHIGHELAGWARELEQARVLDEIASLVIANKVDALVIAGDVFDHQNPSSAMYKMLYEFFDELAIMVPDLLTVMIAGNHDSAGRLEAPGPLLKRANVVAIGSLHLLDGAPDLHRHLIPVHRGDEISGYILAIPYLRPADLPSFAVPQKDNAPSPMVQGIKRLYRQTIKACRKQIGDLPLVVTGHLHVKGASLSESLSERRIVIGGEHAVPADIFGRDADYVALGHLHRAQSLGEPSSTKSAPKKSKGTKAAKTKKPAHGLVRYAGSPMPLSVVERSYEHGVSLVKLTKSKSSCKHLKLSRPVPFLRVPKKGRLKIEEISGALEEMRFNPKVSLEQRPFVQIALQIAGPQPGIRAKLDEICLGFAIRDVAPDIAWPGQKREPKNLEAVKRLGELHPDDLFKEAFIEYYGSEPEDEHIACFHQLLNEVGT
ncbi:MAG: exonuclease SbcCD subunit D [bacterium]|nr:exonuclease SbcCD subunit D [bacterium]